MSNLKEFNLENPPDLRKNTLLEASAGTGKTYTLVRVVRDLIVKQNIPLKNILIVTYTVPATEELKERIQEVLKESMNDTSYTEQERERIQKSYLECDSSPIYTIHGFCKSVLQTYPFESSAPFKTEVDNSSHLLDEVLRDYLTEVLEGSDEKLLRGFLDYMSNNNRGFESSFSSIKKLTDSVLQNPHVHILPETGFDDSWDFLLHTLEEVPRRLNVRKKNQGILDFSGMIEAVYRAIVPEETRRPELINQLRKQYTVALIDEFQDTDSGQWGIFSTLFLHSSRNNLFLIGDPKQSIYGFRGTDLEVYFSARESIPEEHRFLLGGNYRSCPQLVTGLNTLFAPLFQKSYNGSVLEFLPVESRSDSSALSDSRGNSLAPVEFLDYGVECEEDQRVVGIDPIRNGGFEAIADRCSELLNSSLTYKGRPLIPDDIAILTDKNRNAHKFIHLLKARHIPAVFIGDTNICETEEYGFFISLFQALSFPESPGYLKELMLTSFFSPDLEELLNMDQEGGMDHYFFQLSRWKEQVDNGFLLPVMEEIFKEESYWNRTARSVGGERSIANTRQILQMIQDEQKVSRLDCRGILKALTERLWNSASEDDLKLIHERETGCVTVMTVHKSKGLEFPVVLYGAGLAPPLNQADFYSYIDPGTGKRMKDYTKNPSLKTLHNYYQWEELRRVYYVGMTRPESLLVLPYTRTAKTGQAYVLQSVYASFFKERLDEYIRDFGKGFIKKVGDPLYLGSSYAGKEKGEIGRSMVSGFIADEMGRLARQNPEVFRVHKAPQFSKYTEKSDKSKAPLIPPEEPRWKELRTRIIPVSSFTSLVSRGNSLEHKEIHPGAEKDFLQEEPSGTEVLDETENPFLLFRGGAVFGELVHQILENLPFEKARLSLKEFSLDSSVQELIQKTSAVFFSTHWMDKYGDLLYSLVWTTLNTPLPEGLTLKDLPEKDRFAEMEFLFFTEEGPLLHGAENAGITVDEGAVKGYIDLVYKWRGQYYIIDWKTNLPPEGFNGRYGRKCMEHIVSSHRYDLQYKLYLAALIRQLQTIYPEENSEALYEKYIGGVRYIFVRGLGKEQEGVYSDRPLLHELPFY